MATANTPLTSVPADLLKRILVGIPLDDHRAATAACRAFRAVISGPQFPALRRNFGFGERGVVVINDTGDDVLTRPPCWCTTPNLTLGPTRSCPWTDEEEVTGWSMPVPIRANLLSSRIGARHSYVPPKVPGPRSRTDLGRSKNGTPPSVPSPGRCPDPSSSARLLGA